MLPLASLSWISLRADCRVWMGPISLGKIAYSNAQAVQAVSNPQDWHSPHVTLDASSESTIVRHTWTVQQLLPSALEASKHGRASSRIECSLCYHKKGVARCAAALYGPTLFGS